MNNSNMTRRLVILFICVFTVGGVSAHADSERVEQLRADYMALLDARSDFEKTENEAGLTTAEQADFADWIQQLSEQFAARCRELANQSPELIPSDIPCAEFNQAFTAPAQLDIENETSDGEQVAVAVSKFDQSLGRFDEKLLREQDRVKARRPQASAADSGGGAGSGAGSAAGGESGTGTETGESEGSPAQEGQGGKPSDEQGSVDSSGNDQQDQGTRGSSSGSSAPPDTPSGRDDDVIARQLREAAEKEADPELKRKLWEEYKRYKEGI